MPIHTRPFASTSSRSLPAVQAHRHLTSTSMPRLPSNPIQANPVLSQSSQACNAFRFLSHRSLHANPRLRCRSRTSHRLLASPALRSIPPLAFPASSCLGLWPWPCLAGHPMPSPANPPTRCLPFVMPHQQRHSNHPVLTRNSKPPVPRLITPDRPFLPVRALPCRATPAAPFTPIPPRHACRSSPNNVEPVHA